MPGKNLRELRGRSLVARSVEQARATRLFDIVAVSSDSSAILDRGREAGADLAIVRPAHLAAGDVPRVQAIVHAVQVGERLTGIRFDVIVELPPTAPLRSLDDISAVVDLLERSGHSSVITTTPAGRNPYYNMVERIPGAGVRIVKQLADPPVHRQGAPDCYDMNDAVWAWQRRCLLDDPAVLHTDTLMHVMPRERSVDVDTELDLRFAELLLADIESDPNHPRSER